MDIVGLPTAMAINVVITVVASVIGATSNPSL